tara:strand:- start:60 stop:953 length:894 start_codon:yes stop_codon:yes gene_type:complete
MKKIIKIFIMLMGLSFITNASAEGYCDTTGASENDNGVITFTGNPIMANCSFAPDEYIVTIYKIGLCTQEPARPTFSEVYDVSSCEDVINSPNGQVVNIAAGEELVLSDVSKPPNGTYNYGYILMSNNFGFKAKKQFTNTMHTFLNGGSGNYCWTLAGQNDNSEQNAGAWTNPSPLVQCGGADGSAETYYEKLDVFDGDTVSFQMAAFAVGNGTLSIELTTDANKLLVNSLNTADRVFGKQTFTTPVVVKSSTTLFTISFDVNQSATMWMYQDAGRANEYQVYAIGSGPFSLFMTVE